MSAPASIVLASTSPTRRAMLARAGLSFESVAPGVDETLARHGSPVEQCRALARLKAEAVFARRPDAIVIGSDQVLAFAGEVWGKPRNAAVARHQLRRLSGRTHSLLTGLAILAPERPPVVEHVVTRLQMFSLDEDEIENYVRTGEWEGCAGGYRVEGRGIALFAAIEGDWTNVLGLPMHLLMRRLRALGVRPLAS